MEKVLFITNNASYIKSNLKILKESGYKVDVICNEAVENCDKYYNIKFSKKLISITNFIAYKKIKKIIKENNYKFIHCYTLIAGVLARIANQKTKIIYTSDGFSFYKKSSIFKWLLYYSIEKYLSKYTDVLITMNREDLKIATTKFDAKNVKFINGFGIEENLENQIINRKEYVFLSIGELDKNQNQIMQLEAMIWIIKKYPYVKLLITGEGKLEDYYAHIIEKYNLSQNVELIGNRKDNSQLLNLCDCVLSTSKQEGLPIHIIEAMLANKPIIATDIISHRELLKNKNLIKIKDIEALKTEMGTYIENHKNKEVYYDTEKYKLENVEKEMKKIYNI